MEILDNNGLSGEMTYEELQGQTRIEMSRCLQVLGNDISAWTGVPQLEGMGLPQAQRIALVDLMQVMQQRQNNAFTAIDKQLPAPKFADGQGGTAAPDDRCPGALARFSDHSRAA
jgi:hypothetical protein